MTGATARAYPNLALVKYWGKADEALVLPQSGSLSLTLDTFATTTTVTLNDAAEDTLELNDHAASAVQTARVARFLNLARRASGSQQHAGVTSHNEAPTGAGFASSASGFAALAVAASKAYGLQLDARDLSRLARRGSGSASRSIVPGLAVWHAGDDESSFAEPIDGPDIRMVTVTVDANEKAVSSREAMRITAATSPFHSAWVESTAADLTEAMNACQAGDFTLLGEITESNALRMHAVIQAARPPIRYLTANSIAIFDAVAALRARGTECYATADAGPNVAVIVRPADADRVAQALSELGQTRVVGPGAGAHLLTADDATSAREEIVAS